MENAPYIASACVHVVTVHFKNCHFVHTKIVQYTLQLHTLYQVGKARVNKGKFYMCAFVYYTHNVSKCIEETAGIYDYMPPQQMQPIYMQTKALQYSVLMESIVDRIKGTDYMCVCVCTH